MTAAAIPFPQLLIPRRTRVRAWFPPRLAHGIDQVPFTYGTGLHAILYRPANSHRKTALPVCLVLSGGGYINCQIMTPSYPPALRAPEINASCAHKRYVVDLCRWGDMAVIAMQYSATNINGGTVASQATAAIADLHAMVGTWLPANKTTYGLTTTKIGIAGVSAGGQTGGRYAYGDHAFTKPTNIGGVAMIASNFILKSNGVAQVTGDVTKIVTADPPMLHVRAENDNRFEAADSATMTARCSAQSVACTEYLLAGQGHEDVDDDVVLSSGNTISLEIAKFMRPKLS